MRIDKTLLIGAVIATAMFVNTASDARSPLGHNQVATATPTHADQQSIANRTDTYFRRLPAYREGIADLTIILWDEARGEGEQGMLAVGHVVLNRVRLGAWGNSVREVLQARGQFPAFFPHSRKRRLINDVRARYLAGKDLPETMTAARVLADRLLIDHIRGTRQDAMRGATHFHHKRLLPDWTQRMRFIMAKGDHKFWKQSTIVAMR